MIYCYSGLPGSGKTLNATRDIKRKFNKDNAIINKLIYMIKNKTISLENYQYINNVFSNYPILLNKKNKIYSNLITPKSMEMNYNINDNSVIVLDEFQKYFDSRNYKKFPIGLGTLLQHHRHGNIDKIIFLSQHPRRIDNKVRDLCETFRKINKTIVISLFGVPLIGLSFYVDYFDFEDYGKYHDIPKEQKIFDSKKGFNLITYDTFTSYDSKYFKYKFQCLPMIQKIEYTSMELTPIDLYLLGEIDIEELREMEGIQNDVDLKDD